MDGWSLERWSKSITVVKVLINTLSINAFNKYLPYVLWTGVAASTPGVTNISNLSLRRWLYNASIVTLYVTLGVRPVNDTSLVVVLIGNVNC